MTDLTVIIITKNEEKNIKKCVDSFKGIAKRFVVVDSFSDDKTKQKCVEINLELKKIGSRLDFYQNKFVDHATQINWAIDNTEINTKWTMRIDADEELLPELANEISTKLDKINEEINGIVLRRRIIFLGRWLKHGGRYPEYLLRIWKTGYARCEQKLMDEHIILKKGKTITFKNDLQDNNQKNLDWWTSKHNWYSNKELLDYQLTQKTEVKENSVERGVSTTQAKIKRKIKNKGYYKLPMFFRAHLYFIYRYYFRLGFLDGKEGKIFNFLQAYWYRFLVDAKMYEQMKKNIDIEEQGELKI